MVRVGPVQVMQDQQQLETGPAAELPEPGRLRPWLRATADRETIAVNPAASAEVRESRR
jgi:hypothetical protein